MPEVFVGLGSNVAPVANLTAAVQGLMQAFGRVELSNVYESAPIGFEGADFLNMVARFATEASCDEVHGCLSRMEEEAGRVRPAPRLGPRTLDLDLLLYGESVDATRRVPHPDVLAYPFVLWPLAELAPAARHPLLGMTFAAARDAQSGRDAGLTCRGKLAALR